MKSPSGYDLRFWKMGEPSAPVAWKAPAGTTLKGLTWHPAKEKTLFLLSASGTEHRILRLEEKGGAWTPAVVLKSPTTLRRILIGPRPSLYSTPKGELVTEYRIYYGAALRGGAWSTRSVTESGVRDVQIAGPKATMDRVPGEDESPSSVFAPSALPLSFHPAGDRLLFEEPGKRYREARFTGNWSEEEKPFFAGRLSGGTATWLANGLGLVHWTSGVAGVELVFAPKMESRRVAAEWTFATTPANVPDGRGLVGLTKGADGRQTLRYVPVEIPLGNVVNAWMFVEGKDDADRFARHGGLFRTSDAEQLHSVYDAELYTGSTARRPFVVTTDVFWEDFAAAFQGLFVLRERVQAIPAFWEFVKGARTALSGPGGSKVWGPVFAAAAELEAAAGSAKPAAGIGPEAARILALKSRGFARRRSGLSLRRDEAAGELRRDAADAELLHGVPLPDRGGAPRGGTPSSGRTRERARRPREPPARGEGEGEDAGSPHTNRSSRRGGRRSSSTTGRSCLPPGPRVPPTGRVSSRSPSASTTRSSSRPSSTRAGPPRSRSRTRGTAGSSRRASTSRPPPAARSPGRSWRTR